MRASATLLGALLVVAVLAVPALAVEEDLDGGNIMEGSRYDPNEDFTHAEFTRFITNLIDEPVDITPRDLRMAEYPIMTVTSITVSSFDNGIWTIGTLEPGQTATIAYTGDAAPAATTTTQPTSTTTTIVATTTTAPGATTTAAPEELPHTGQRDDLAAFAFAGLALIGLGVSTLRVTRN